MTIRSNIDGKGLQPADAITTRIVNVTGLFGGSIVTGLVVDAKKGYEVNHELTAIKLTPHRHILVPGDIGMNLGLARCIFQDKETYAPVICYDEVYKFSVVRCDPAAVTLPPDTDAPPFSGVHLEG
jgi:hypothetical protein